jgi:uncharacterized protein (DUF305 family)
MKNESMLYGIIGLLAGILIGIYVASNAVNNNAYGMMRMMGMRYGTNGITGTNMMNSTESIDAHFIEQMIPHHEDAITMAEIARTKAKKQEIKDLAKAIIAAQTNEINEMKQWYKDWYGTDVPQDENVMGGHGMMGSGGMHMGMMGDETDMTRLENAQDFDKAFIEEMIPHHQMAVMMANMLRSGTQREEMKQLADDIISAQTSEIDQMRSWYQTWYK